MGSLPVALVRKLFGGESLFVGEYGGPNGGELCLSPALPGSVLSEDLNSSELFMTAGSFLACTPGVEIKPKFGGLKAFFTGEGAVLLLASGTGKLFMNAYGGVIEKQVDGEITVDTGHLVAWEPTLDYRIGGMGGLKSTLFSGEGLTMKFSGKGRLFLQTRHLSGTSSWLLPFLRA